MNSRHAWLAIQLYVQRVGVGTTLVVVGLFGLAAYAAVADHLLARELAAARASLTAPAPGPHSVAPMRTPAPAARDGLREFSAALLPRRRLPDFLAGAWKSAEADGIQISKADYRLDRDAKGQFSRVHVAMPVTGTYPAIRRYAFKLMAKNANLALAKFDLKRQRPGDAEIEAELQFIIFVSDQ